MPQSMQKTEVRLGLRKRNLIINKKLICDNTNVNYLHSAPLGNPLSLFLTDININKNIRETVG
jgi:hypothetical protein